MHNPNFFYDEKTANVILVYQYIRKKENKQSSRVTSLRSHHRLASESDFVTPLGRATSCHLEMPKEEGEPLDSGGWQRTPQEEINL